jgi:molybdopterin-guanine dinucleotide biosynthesis protein A
MFAAILSGGENTRFPQTKGFIELGGKKIIENSLEVLRGIFGQVVISTNEPEKYFYLGAPLIGDIYPPQGPMTGIFSVLKATGAEDIFVISCDMPFINGELIKALIKEKKSGTGAPHLDAIVPLWRGRPEPLFAIYSAGCAGVLEKRILEGRAGLQLFLSEINVLYMEEDYVRAIDPGGRSFVNINTPEDLDKAKALITEEK